MNAARDCNETHPFPCRHQHRPTTEGILFGSHSYKYNFSHLEISTLRFNILRDFCHFPEILTISLVVYDYKHWPGARYDSHCPWYSIYSTHPFLIDFVFIWRWGNWKYRWLRRKPGRWMLGAGSLYKSLSINDMHFVAADRLGQITHIRGFRASGFLIFRSVIRGSEKWKHEEHTLGFYCFQEGMCCILIHNLNQDYLPSPCCKMCLL